MIKQICEKCKRTNHIHLLDGWKWKCVCDHVNTVDPTNEGPMTKDKAPESRDTGPPPQKRIENPTCGTCRWFEGEFGEDYGYCFLMPPIVLDKPSCALAYERPGVWRENYCSHHQSAVYESTGAPVRHN